MQSGPQAFSGTQGHPIRAVIHQPGSFRVPTKVLTKPEYTRVLALGVTSLLWPQLSGEFRGPPSRLFSQRFSRFQLRSKRQTRLTWSGGLCFGFRLGEAHLGERSGASESGRAPDTKM